MKTAAQINDPQTGRVTIETILQQKSGELQNARKQLIEMRILFFVLCLKYLKPEVEFTPKNLAAAMLKKTK
jgi:hypothetical protein